MTIDRSSFTQGFMSRWPASYQDRLGTPSGVPYLIQESSSEFPKAFEYRFPMSFDDQSDPMDQDALHLEFGMETESESVKSHNVLPTLANAEPLEDKSSPLAPVFELDWDRSESMGIGAASLLWIVNFWSRVSGST